ncbi:hypothetical protein DPMN_146514 [Dreissena polymorpha]|uniref:Uncharacterized protein n=1 Tax=Dreissena polymorpha TaxID=45954 RepID=A0A9D4J2E9_DREPO|nr:hypothetical protein DPMN_146514 [Dreissena polymorpha]
MLFDTHPLYIRGLLVDLKTVIEDINSLNRAQEDRVQLLQEAYKEHERHKLQQMRHNINSTINTFSRIPLTTYSASDNTIKEQTNMSIINFLDDFDNNILKELNAMKDEVIKIKHSITKSIKKCTGLQNYLTLLYETIPKIGYNKELRLIVTIKCGDTIQQALAVLGKSGNVFTVQEKSEHSVRIPSDSNTCWISAICVLPHGQVLVVDWGNKKVKLLNKQFQVVSHWDSIDTPQDICKITRSEVAVTVDGIKTHKIHFFIVIKNHLIPGRYLELEHSCRGITHHQGILFICSGSAAYTYSLIGKLVCRIYEDQSSGLTGTNHVGTL